MGLPDSFWEDPPGPLDQSLWAQAVRATEDALQEAWMPRTTNAPVNIGHQILVQRLERLRDVDPRVVIAALEEWCNAQG